MRHRIFLAPAREGLSPAEFQHHWQTVHAPIFAGTPGLLGYVQNRPVEEDWRRLIPYQACAESWFESAEAERAGFDSDYYRTTVAEDEARFVDRAGAWASVVLEDPVRPGPLARFRVLAFGADLRRLPPDAGGTASILRLRRQPPAAGPSGAVSVWTDDLDEARRLRGLLGGLAFVATPEPVVVPPVPPWSERQG